MPNIINNNYYSSGSGQNGQADIDIGISFSPGNEFRNNIL